MVLLKLLLVLFFNYIVWSVYRTYQSIQDRVSRQMLPKIGTALFLFWIFAIWTALKYQKLFLVFLILGIFIPKLLHWFVNFHRDRNFKKQLLLFLNTLILKMHIGFGFRSAMEQSIPKNEDVFALQIKKIINSVVFSQQKVEFKGSSGVLELYENLKYADKHPEVARSIIKNYKNKLTMIQNFRRKSLQVTLNIRLQVMILSALYLGMFLFSSYQFGWSGNERLFLSSFCLFSIGLLVSHFLFRRWKWKT